MQISFCFPAAYMQLETPSDVATTIFKHPTSYYFKKMLYLCQRK